MPQEAQMRILQMLEEGKITSEGAARLLGAVEETDVQAAVLDGTGPARRLVIRIWDGKPEDERPTVNLSLPVGLIEWGLKFAQQSGKAAGLEDLNVGDLQDLIEEGGRGELLHIDDGNDRIRIELV